jgi:hypothetical protein
VERGNLLPGRFLVQEALKGLVPKGLVECEILKNGILSGNA